MAETLAMRAARWFGVEDQPRTSVALGPNAVALVIPRGERMALAVYHDEYGSPRSFYKLMTEKQRDDLTEALRG